MIAELALSRRRAVVLVIVQIASLQLGAVVAKHVIAEVGGATTAGLRISFAACAVWLIARPSPRQIRRTDLPLLLAFGVVLAAMNVSFFEALRRVPLGIATTIEFLGPLGLVLATAQRPRDAGWGMIAAAGLMLLTWTSGSIDPIGLGFAAVAAVCRALYIVCSQAVGLRFRSSAGLCVALLVGTALVLPPSLATNGRAMLAPGILVAGFAVALLSSAIPYALDMATLRRLPARTFGVLISLAPAVAAMFGYLFLGQHLRSVQLTGIGLVVLASLGVLRSFEPKSASASSADDHR